MTPRLLKKNTLTFTRYLENSGQYVRGTWQEGTEDDPVVATGNLQPYRQGKERVDLPEGIKARHAKVFYTTTLLLGYDDISNQEADKTTIDGVTFVVYDAEDWDTPAYRSKHYKVYLVREDKM